MNRFSYILACVVVPILWGGAVHWLFDAWQRRRQPIDAAEEDAIDERTLP